MDRPLPSPTKVSRPFWEACRNRRLTVQRCADCGFHAYFPVYACPECLSDRVEWVEASGKGTVFSVTVVERGAGGAFEAELPFCVALVELSEGPVMMSNVVGVPPHSVRIGDAVQVDFRDVSDEVTLPVFRPVAAEAGK